MLAIAGPTDDGNALAALKTAAYNALVKKKLPANLQDALGLLQLAGFAAQGKLPGPTYAYGFGKLDEIAVPSDITVAGYIPDTNDRTQLHPIGTTVTLDNEGLYWWDVSVGYPVTKVKDLQYTQTGNTIQASQVDKSTMLAMANLYLWPVDIKNSGSSFHPSIIAGVGLQGKVRERLVAGIATNLPPIPGWKFTKSGWYQLLQPYAGVEFLTTSRPVADQASGAPTMTLRTVRKLAFGLEIPVKSTIQRLAAGKQSQTSTSSSTANTTKPTAKPAAAPQQ